MTPDPTNQPTGTPPEPPKDEAPDWAKQLLDTTSKVNERLDALEENIKPEEPPAPSEPEPEPPAWQPKSWDDVDARAKEVARQEAEALQAERDKEAQKAAEQDKKTQQEVDQYLDSQVKELRESKFLPEITSTTDPNDPGKLAEKELYGYAMSMGTADLKAVSTSLDALHKAGKAWDFVKNELVDRNPDPAGRSAPVGSSSAGATQTGTGISYKEIHNTSMDGLAQRFLEQ